MSKQKSEQRAGAFSQELFTRKFLAADYSACRSMLREDEDSERRALLQASLDFREQRYVEMLEPLLAMQPKTANSGFERDALLGAAYGHTKDYSAARNRLNRVIEKTRPGDRLHNDAVYYKALVAWIEHEHRESEALATLLLQNASPNESARAHNLLSWIAARRRDLDRQLEELSQSLNALKEASQPDEYYRAKALVTLTLLSRELPLAEETRRARGIYDEMQWTSAMQLQQYQCARHFGWIEALNGDQLSAFRWYREAMSLAPSGHWKVLSLTDRAYLAKNTGELSFADDLLHEAHGLAQSLSWHETAHEERSALFVLAELFSNIQPSLSEQYLAQFRALHTSVLPGVSYGDDPRTRAFALYSSGEALLELGEKQEAIAILSESHETFAAFHYGWRAALCALALHKATGDSSWLVEARRQIAPWPQSWVARDVATETDKSQGERLLSKAQKRVLDLLLEGKSNVDIAKALGRSPYTVRNHIAQLFRTYNVGNRTQLAGLFRTHKKAGR